MKKVTYCSKEEISNMVADYKNGKSVTHISKEYNRSMATVIKKLTDAGIYKQRNLNLTEDDMEFIKDRYSAGCLDEIFESYPKLNKSYLQHLMCKSGVKTNFKWSEQEVDLLLSNYSKIEFEELCKLLSNRSKKSIKSKAVKLGLTKSRIWTEEEDKILYNNYSSMNLDDICIILPSRTREAIINRARKLGLKNLVDYKDKKYQILINNWKTKTDDEISKIIGCSKRTILANRMKYGLFKNNYERTWSSQLSAYIRENNSEWKLESIKSCNYKCVITGNKFDDIHHIHGFNLIFAEMIENITFELNRSFEDFTSEELSCVLNEFKKIQSKYPLGICLCKDIHREFHKIYGYGNNTEVQWNEFITKLVA